MFYGLRYLQSVSGHTKVWRLWPPSTSGSMVALFLAMSGTIQGRPESRDINGKETDFGKFESFEFAVSTLFDGSFTS
jgi:hypothetical protein